VRRVALAGATGLVGQSLLAGLLADATVGEVHVVTRRAPLVSHVKLRARVPVARGVEVLLSGAMQPR
jgi:uncharacterized protein YbjT (DUF2867 family)